MKACKTYILVFLGIISLSMQGVMAAGKQESKQTPVQKHGKLSVKGTQLVGEKGEPVVLKGVSFGWHNWWSDFYNPVAVSNVVDEWKSTVVRAAIGVGPQGSYLDNKELALKCATTVADAAIEKGVYIILDWHSHEIHTEAAKEFFTEMATRYKNYPNVIYELFNEPVEQSWEEVKTYSIELIKTIRAIDPDHLIIVGVPHWDQDVHIAADNPIQGYSNLIYALHFYAATHKDDLRKRADYALSKGLPLFVSECAGMEASGDGPINRSEWNEWLKWMQERNISWVAWSISNKNETCSMIKPGVNPQGKWKEEDLKEWAKVVIESLR